MSEIFGKASDFDLDETELKNLYEKIQNNEQIDMAFDGAKVDDFKDLLDIEKNEKDEKLNSLLNEMYK